MTGSFNLWLRNIFVWPKLYSEFFRLFTESGPNNGEKLICGPETNLGWTLLAKDLKNLRFSFPDWSILKFSRYQYIMDFSITSFFYFYRCSTTDTDQRDRVCTYRYIITANYFGDQLFAIL
jgi:hypothetical protein